MRKTAYFVPGMSLDLREFELCVVWIHALDLLPCWCAQNLSNQRWSHFYKSTVHKNKHVKIILNALNKWIYYPVCSWQNVPSWFQPVGQLHFLLETGAATKKENNSEMMTCYALQQCQLFIVNVAVLMVEQNPIDGENWTVKSKEHIPDPKEVQPSHSPLTRYQWQWCTLWPQKWAPVLGSIENICMRCWAPLSPMHHRVNWIMIYSPSTT